MTDGTHRREACVIHDAQLTRVSWCSARDDGSNCQMLLLQKYNSMQGYSLGNLPVTKHSDDKIESVSVKAEHMYDPWSLNVTCSIENIGSALLSMSTPSLNHL